MLPGDFEAQADTKTLWSYAVVRGARREIEDFDVDRDMSNDLPSQVGGMSGIGKSRGTITWAQPASVTDKPVSPWIRSQGWPPQPGDPVEIWVTDGQSEWPRFTGVIDESTGDPLAPGFTSTVIDPRDELNRLGTLPALLRHHTPYEPGNTMRRVGLDHLFVLTTLLRQAGVCNTPPASGVPAVSATLQGSVWADRGAVYTAHGSSSTGTHAAFYPESWGYSAADFEAVYLPDTALSINVTTQLSLQLGENHAGVFYFEARYDSGQRVRLRGWDGSRRVTAQYYTGSSWVSVTTLGPTEMADASGVSLVVKYGVWTLRNDTGYEASGTQATTGGVIEDIRVTASDAARISSVLVTRPTSAVEEHAPVRFTPRVTFERGTFVGMDMSRTIENENIAAVVEEICAATLTAAWWDERGVLRLVGADRLRVSSPVQTITTLDDITDVEWQESLRSTRKAVAVHWKDSLISHSLYQRQELYRGRADSMGPEDVVEVFAAPDSDTEWFGVDWEPRHVDDTSWSVYNRGIGSFTGVHYLDADGEEVTTSGRTTSIVTERLGLTALKITHRVVNMSGAAEVVLASSEASEWLKPHLRSNPLPVIKGMGLGTWVETTEETAHVGPAHAPTLTHDLDTWGRGFASGGSVAKRIADWLIDQVKTPKPLLTRLTVTYDPRRQLGDIYTLYLRPLGVNLRVLLVGIEESMSHMQATQDLTVRLVAVTTTSEISYEALSANWQGGDYAGLEAVWANLTYDDFADERIERGNA